MSLLYQALADADVKEDAEKLQGIFKFITSAGLNSYVGCDVERKTVLMYLLSGFDEGHKYQHLLVELFNNPNFDFGGLEVDRRTKYGDTALMYAAMNNRHEIVKKLLELGANPEVRNNRNLSPFWCACYEGYIESFKILLPYVTNQEFDLKDKKGKTARDYADVEMVMLIDVARAERRMPALE